MGYCSMGKPSQFLKSVISPIVKDYEGDVTSTDNYRAISISVLLSQLFEKALLMKFQEYLCTDDLQFGFKAGHSTSHAIFTLKSVVDYFLNHGSGLYVTLMDCSKAFDKISHEGLFSKLMEREVPLCFLLIIVYWYSNMTTQCKWNDAFSYWFEASSGTKQGGVLSPRFFAVYIDDLIKLLRSTGLGCFIIAVFIACIFYADDLTLLSPL
jgi:hypothetical protein